MWKIRCKNIWRWVIFDRKKVFIAKETSSGLRNYADIQNVRKLPHGTNVYENNCSTVDRTIVFFYFKYVYIYICIYVGKTLFVETGNNTNFQCK